MSNMLDAYKMNKINLVSKVFKKKINQLRNQSNQTITIIRIKPLTDNEKQQQIQKVKISFLKNQSKLKRKLKDKFKLIWGLQQTPKPISAKKALLIGINYTGTRNQLNGCINDVNDVGDYLRAKGFSINLITDLTTQKPIRSTILVEFANLLKTSNKGDVLYFMFSGHGSIKMDTNNDEVSGIDQLIIPLDLKPILDDDLKSIINKCLPKGVTLIALFDSCFSGTVLDLKYQYMNSLNYDKPTVNNKVSSTNGTVFMISGCTDKQTSEDAYINNRFNGALTWSYLNVLRSNPSNLTWQKLVKMMRDTLKSNNHSQIPQFSCGKPTNIDETIRW